jgi:hypothetical protein
LRAKNDVFSHLAADAVRSRQFLQEVLAPREYAALDELTS